MTIFIVDESGQGDYKTIGAALQAAKLGDTIRVLNGVYRERVNIGVPKIVLEAADGHTPEIDGGWNGKTVESGFAAQVQVQAPGVLVRGLTIRNCPGRGLGVTADNVTVRSCRIDNTYQGAMYVGPGTKDDKSEESDGPAVRGILVEGCIMSRMSQSWVTETRPKGVNGGINFHTVEDGEFRDNFASDGWGEIFNLGRGSKRVRVVGNIFHSGNHVLGYLNRCQECEFIGNILFHVPDAAYRNKDGEWSAGIVIGDERGRAVKNFPFSRGNIIRGNVVVNTGVLLHVRNNTKDEGGYDTQLLDTEIAYNTLVGGPSTRGGIIIQPNMRGRKHAGSVFRDNVIDCSAAPNGTDIGTFSDGVGVKFERNAWSTRPPQTMQSKDDLYGVFLTNPAAAITRARESVESRIDLNDYRPRPNSVLAATNIGALAATELTEPPVEPPPIDPPVEPPLPDTAALVGLTDSALASLALAKHGIADAEEKLRQLMSLLGEEAV